MGVYSAKLHALYLSYSPSVLHGTVPMQKQLSRAESLKFANAEPTVYEVRRNLLISAIVFLCSFALALMPEVFDKPTTRLINGLANHFWLLDYATEAVSKYYTYSGILLMAIIWYCFFENEDPERRARLLVGVIASIFAGGISRILQHTLRSHPRPYLDPTLDFQQPLGLTEVFNNWNSFPSDHATVFSGLAIVLFVVRSNLVVFAMALTAIICCFRNFIGAHYPTDLISGAGLAAFAVWTSQLSWPVAAGRTVLRCERSSPSLFYMSAFFFSYQIATLFNDIRHTLGPIRDHFLSH